MVAAVEKAGVPQPRLLQLPPHARRQASSSRSSTLGKLGRIYHYRASFLQDWTISPDVPQGGGGHLGARRRGGGLRRHRRPARPLHRHRDVDQRPDREPDRDDRDLRQGAHPRRHRQDADGRHRRRRRGPPRPALAPLLGRCAGRSSRTPPAHRRVPRPWRRGHLCAHRLPEAGRARPLASQKKPGFNYLLLPKDTPGGQIVPELTPEPDDVVMLKTTDSALTGTNLRLILRNMEISRRCRRRHLHRPVRLVDRRAWPTRASAWSGRRLLRGGDDGAARRRAADHQHDLLSCGPARRSSELLPP